jgi:hypothetical protein
MSNLHGETVKLRKGERRLETGDRRLEKRVSGPRPPVFGVR